MAFLAAGAGTAKRSLSGLALRFFQLPSKLGQIDAVFGGLARADENDRDIPSVALSE